MGAIALRQAIQAQQNASDRDKSIPWRVLHRVIFISRVLPHVDSPQATPMERALIKANLRILAMGDAVAGVCQVCVLSHPLTNYGH